MKDKNPHYIYFLGIFIALASLTRNTGFLFFLSILLIFSIKFVFQKSEIYLKYIQKVTIGFFSIYVWYFIYNFMDKGVFFYDYNYLNFALYYNKHYKIQTYNNIFDVLFKNSIINHLNHISSNIQTAFVIFYSIFGILVILFIFSLLYLKQDNNLGELYIIFIIYLIGHILSFIVPEFLIAIYPIFILGILVSLRNLVKILSNYKDFNLKLNHLFLNIQIKKYSSLLLVILLLFSFYSISINNINYDKNIEKYYNNDYNIRETSDYLNEIMTKNETFMTLLPIYGYYIKSQFLEINIFKVKYLFEHFFYSNLSSIDYNTLPRNPTTSNPYKIANYVIIDTLIKQDVPDLCFLYLPTNKSIIPSYLIPIQTFKFTSIYEINQTLIENLKKING